MSSTDRDPAVARALRELPVPDHGPGFWDRVEAELAQLTPAAVTSADPDRDMPPKAAEGTEPIVLRGLRQERQAHRPRVLAIAAAVLVIAAVAGLVRVRDHGEQRVGTDQHGSTPTSSVPQPTQPPVTVGAPAATVLAWVDALGAGDVDAAAALVGPRSTAYVEALGGSVRGFMVESQEGYGSWAASSDRQTVELDVPKGDGGVTIVILSGTNPGEGSPGFRTDAIPTVRRDDGLWQVEPFAFDPDAGGRIELTPPAASPELVVTVDAPGQGAFLFSLDGEPLVESGSAPHGTWDPPGAVSSGSHLLVVVYLDGVTVSALATTLTVP